MRGHHSESAPISCFLFAEEMRRRLGHSKSEMGSSRRAYLAESSTEENLESDRAEADDARRRTRYQGGRSKRRPYGERLNSARAFLA